MCFRLLCYRLQPGHLCLSYEERLIKFRVQSLETLILLLLSVISVNIKFRARKSNKANLFVLQIFKDNVSFYNPLTRMARHYFASNNIELNIFFPKLSHFTKVIETILHINGNNLSHSSVLSGLCT